MSLGRAPDSACLVGSGSLAARTNLAVDAGNGPVAPSLETVLNGAYPLTRPLFIYTDRQTLQTNVAAAAFISYYLQHANEVIREVGYFATSDAVADEAQKTLVAALR
jgi:phosphate transport system substrate-binding protein